MFCVPLIVLGFIAPSITTLGRDATKLTGEMLFTLPLTLQFIDLRYSAALSCVIAAAAAIQEGHFIRAGQMLRSR